jgi:hypothetical protein
MRVNQSCDDCRIKQNGGRTHGQLRESSEIFSNDSFNFIELTLAQGDFKDILHESRPLSR